MAGNTSTPVRFRGTPAVLSAVASTASAGSHVVRLEPKGNKRAAKLEATVVAVAADPLLRLHLPRNTPPGTYEGSMDVDGQEHAVVITVEPDVFVRLLPDRLVFDARAGERKTFDLTMLNLGNVAVDIRGAYAFGVFDVAGADRAIGRMVTGEVKEGQSRVDLLADAVVEEHGGLVKVKIEKGEGTLEPGESRDLSVALYVPARIRAGHTYWGTWPILNLRHYVRITGLAGEPVPKVAS